MLGTSIQQKIVSRDYDIFAGLDVDKKHFDVTFLDHDNHMKSMKIPSNPTHLINYTRKHYRDQKVVFVYEAGPTGYGLHKQLTSAGYRCLVVAPALVPTIPGKKVKTNRLDSKKLSLSLRGGELNGIYIPSPLIRHLRHLTQLRDVFMKQVIGSKVRIKALLLFEGLPFPESETAWSYSAVVRLKQLDCSAPIRFKLNRLIENLTWSQNQVRIITRQIQRHCQDDPDLKRSLNYLMSIPGIGQTVSSHLLARIGEGTFLRHSRQVSGFLGVVPCEDSTGDNIKKGSITSAGDARLRSKLIQAAWSSIRKDPELREFYDRIYKRNPKPMAAQKAITAVANKLCKRIACVLKQQRPYVVRPLAVSKKEETALPQGTTRLSSDPRTPCVA